MPDRPMIAALSTAALRGVRIDVLTPQTATIPRLQWAARAYYWLLGTVCASSNGRARSTTAS